MYHLFSDDSEWERFKKELLSWVGTPYRHLTKCKGRGADCTLFIAVCLKECGYLKKIEYNYYPRDWYIHTVLEYILDGWSLHMEKHILSHLAIQRLTKAVDLMRGDVLGFSTTKMGVTNHCSILLESNRMIHSIPQHGVNIMTHGSYWKRRFTQGFRLMVK